MGAVKAANQQLKLLIVDIMNSNYSLTMTVKLHHLANQSYDQAIQKLCDELNATETQFPRTNLRLVFKLGSK